MLFEKFSPLHGTRNSKYFFVALALFLAGYGNIAPVMASGNAPTGNVIIIGAAIVGQTLTTDTSTIADEDGLPGSFNYQWLRDSVAIGSITDSTYTLGNGDIGTLISVRVSYIDGKGHDESLTSTPTTAVIDSSDVHLKGKFGPLHSWPIIPLAMVLTPDGRVFVYGSNTEGAQTGKLQYVIWDPSFGIADNAFTMLPNTTDTDIFCAGQAIIPNTGHTLLVGGDAAINAKRNYANDNVNIFDPTTNTLTRQSQSMVFKRWYATAVTLPNGEHAVLGGRNDRNYKGSKSKPPTVASYSPTPEVRATDGSWRTLSSATSDDAYGVTWNAWFYPRAWVNPQGSLFILTHLGTMYNLDTSGTGTLTLYTSKKAKTAAGRSDLSSIMFAPGRILSLRKNRVSVIIDINGTEPVRSASGNLSVDRRFGNTTLLADGQVWANGGSSTGNDLEGAALDSELWNPNTKVWTTTASAVTARLYHSASLLLPDGSVITGGGGSPGPLKQLNGEIFYPPYLFKTDGSGEFASRPEIIDAPTAMLAWDQEFSVEATESIVKATLVRVGAVTHAFNNETRFFDLSIPQAGNIVTLRTPLSANVAPPGYYLLFVWNAAGTPSVAKFIQIG